MKERKITNTTRRTWYKLDLSANVYPTLQKESFSSVYRITAVMKAKVDPEVLQKAVDLTIPRFPTFNVAIHKGLFWRYLEPNHKPGPFVMKDISNPCMPMNFKSENGYLIRFYYYENRISFEAFHSLADGGGALYLIKTLAATYLNLLGHKIPIGNGVLNINEEAPEEELEDSYIKYANSKIKRKRSQEKAYRIRGTKEEFYTLNIINGIMPVDKLLEKSRQHKVSLTEYLNAVLIYALLEKQKSDNPFRERPVKLAMPVSLRRFFPSNTLRNFISMVYPTIDPRLGDYTFEEILKQVHFYMRYYLNDKFLNADITTNAATQQSPFIRIVPLFIKDIVVRLFYIRVQDKQSTAGLTNLGVIETPPEMHEYIERFDVLMGQPFSPRTNCAIASYGNILTINFASSIIESDVEMLFFRKLVKEGIPVKIESNKNMEVM